MKLESLNDIKKLIDLCRKAGVESIKVEGLELKLGELPETRRYTRRQSQSELPVGTVTDGVQVVDEDSMNPEDLLFWSATGQKSGSNL